MRILLLIGPRSVGVLTARRRWAQYQFADVSDTVCGITVCLVRLTTWTSGIIRRFVSMLPGPTLPLPEYTRVQPSTTWETSGALLRNGRMEPLYRPHGGSASMNCSSSLSKRCHTSPETLLCAPFLIVASYNIVRKFKEYPRTD